jgi:hypothetical protein
VEKPFNSLRAGLHSGAVLQVFVPWEAQMSASFFLSRKNYSVRGGMGSAGRFGRRRAIPPLTGGEYSRPGSLQNGVQKKRYSFLMAEYIQLKWGG